MSRKAEIKGGNKMKMNKLMAIAMATTMVVGSAMPAFAAEEEGAVLNINCWNEEFKTRVTDHYPGYEEVDATTGKIGDVTVVWTITPNDDNAYQNNLDATLLAQADAAADEKVDIFCFGSRSNSMHNFIIGSFLRR